jgi:hypothetical protein
MRRGEKTYMQMVQEGWKICLVSLRMSLHLCCLESLALLQVWLCSRTSKSLSLGDVLALMKHQFHAPTCRVNV